MTPLQSGLKSTRLEPMDVLVSPAAPPQSDQRIAVPALAVAPRELKPAWCFLAAPVAIGLATAALVNSATNDRLTVTQVIGTVLVMLWSVAGIALGVRRRQDRLGPIVLAGAVASGVLCLAQSLAADPDSSGNDRRLRGLLR